MKRASILAFMVCVLAIKVLLPHQTDYLKQKQIIDDFTKRYPGYYSMLLEIERDTLSDSSRILLDDILAIFRSPGNKALWTQYLTDFPKTFSDFCRIFAPRNNKELYDGYVFLRLFEDILQERPEEGAVILVGLSVDARYDADAPGHLQRILANFICNYYDFFIGPFNKLAHVPQENIITFICDIENYAAYREFDCIIDKLREQNNLDLLKRFTAAKDERIRIGPHGEKRIKK